MKFIKFFLASSIVEFETERRELKAFIGHLNDIYIYRGIYFELTLCENLSNAIQKYGSQEMYNNKIRESDYFYILVGKNLGEFTLEEYEVALSHFRQKETPLIYPYFFKVDDASISPGVISFMERLNKELKHYYSHFSEIASIKLNILLELISDSRINGFISFQNGQASVDNQPILDLTSIPLYKNNKNISELLNRKKSLEQEFSRLSVDIKSAKSTELYIKWLNVSQEKETVSEELYRCEKEILALFSTMTKLSHEDRQLTWRERRACELINQGNSEEAIILLRDESRTKELSIAESLYENGITGIRGYISENRLLIETLKTSDIPAKIIPELIQYFETNLALSRKYHIEPACYIDYIKFLDYQKDYPSAIELGEELLSDQSMSDHADPIDLYTILGLLYTKTHQHEKAEVFLRKACSESQHTAEDSLTYAYSCSNLAYLLSDKPAQAQEAEALYHKAISIIENDPAMPSDQKPKALLGIYCNLGALLHSTYRYSEAEDYYIKAQKICMDFYDMSPVHYSIELCTIQNNLGNLYSSQNDLSKATVVFNSAIKILEKLAAYNSSVFLPELAMVYNNYGLVLCKCDKEAARTMLKKALGIRKKLAKKNPLTYEIDVAQTANNLALLLSTNNKKSKDAEALFKEALRIRESLDPEYYSHLAAQTHQDFANYYALIKNNAEAEKHFKKSIAAFQKASEYNFEMLSFYKAPALNDYGAFLFNNFGAARSLEALEAFKQALYILSSYNITREPFSSAYNLSVQNIDTILNSIHE
ncbi:tetratricopeptide repeat protein [Ruminococcus sp. 5_1_39BFAA]|uniref:tetratricopeptide repeat protein n=1 Tax=Ruminococcus sp. 5_1_39BFAA TaxID=457412 RepID=UPI0035667B64